MAEAEIDALIDRGLAAVEDEKLDEADEILEEARHLAGENHVRVLHLSGLLAWARDDLEHATGYLMQATDLGPTRPEIYLDCAECLFTVEEIEEAEVQTRAALELHDLPREQEDEARLLLAQLRLADDDPGEALEVLDGVDAARKDHPAFLSTRGAALLGEEKFAEAVADLRRAVEHEPDDADMHYQLGLALEYIGEVDAARQAMKRVLELDLEEWKDVGEELPAPDFGETQELRSRLEDVLEELPDPVLKLVAAAPITVQARATEEQVAAGVNPRSVLGFLGTPKRDGADAQLEGIVVMRDLLLAEIDEDDEIEGELFEALMEEMQVFFKRTDLVFAEG
jgi:Flp pilus assembly protein TadD